MNVLQFSSPTTLKYCWILKLIPTIINETTVSGIICKLVYIHLREEER